MIMLSPKYVLDVKVEKAEDVLAHLICDSLNENCLNRSLLVIQKDKNELNVQSYIGIVE